jgi:hypothetical protein
MLDLARRLNRFDGRCSYHHNPKSDLGLFADASLTFIYSNITLQHIPPRLAMGYISEFIRLLRDDGIAVFQLPSHFESPVIQVRRWLRARAAALHQLYRNLLHGVSHSQPGRIRCTGFPRTGFGAMSVRRAER